MVFFSTNIFDLIFLFLPFIALLLIPKLVFFFFLVLFIAYAFQRWCMVIERSDFRQQFRQIVQKEEKMNMENEKKMALYNNNYKVTKYTYFACQVQQHFFVLFLFFSFVFPHNLYVIFSKLHIVLLSVIPRKKMKKKRIRKTHTRKPCCEEG